MHDDIHNDDHHHYLMTTTLGMATYDDFDGVFFSVEAAKLYHQIDEVIIVDNNPDSKQGQATEAFAKKCGAKYIASVEKKGTSVRDRIFREATGDLVICIDSHVLLSPGAVEAAKDYLKGAEVPILLQGPMLGYTGSVYGTHWEPKWRNGMFGTWNNSNFKEPTDIPLMGLGAFCCLKKHWQGFNRAFRGFGGEEGYIHEKFRIAGGRCVCHPDFKWLHRFERPEGLKYHNSWDDRIFNYVLGHLENGQDIGQVFHAFDKIVKPETLAIAVREAMEEHYRQIAVEQTAEQLQKHLTAKLS